MNHRDFSAFYYITHIDNVPSILKNGIYCHEYIDTYGVKFTPVYNTEIVSNRKLIKTGDGHSLWEYTNLYFQPRNPMLYRVINDKGASNIAIISIKKNVLNRDDIYITTGNAAHSSSEILTSAIAKKKMTEIIQNSLYVEWWNDRDGSKRKIMAECLVPGNLPPEYIDAIYVAEHSTKESIEKIAMGRFIPTVVQPDLFFRPSRIISITERLSLFEGDLFFSKMQTLTISVNVVGIMGKGLASRAKYQFPDVYVYYQDLCRNKKLAMGKPNLYKREVPYDIELADDFNLSSTPEMEKWFLLFPTKKHWRENSDISGIEKGLLWLTTNYEVEGIKSIAIPALGCGLGNLSWSDVGPLMCHYLTRMKIPVSIYLPAEKKIPDAQLSESFLLSM